jgi:cell division ATPase FtsA
MVEDIIQRPLVPCKQCMKDAGVDASKINEVVLVGGQTRMPRIQALVKELFGQGRPQGSESRRSGGDWRGDSGRRAWRRGERSVAAGRDSAVFVD